MVITTSVSSGKSFSAVKPLALVVAANEGVAHENIAAAHNSKPQPLMKRTLVKSICLSYPFPLVVAMNLRFRFWEKEVILLEEIHRAGAAPCFHFQHNWMRPLVCTR